MSHLIRILFALQICILVVAGCAVDEDSAVDTELTASGDVADPGASEAVVTPDVAEAAIDGAAAVTTQGESCVSLRLNNRATAGSCSSACSRAGRLRMQRFDNRNKICVCCPIFGGGGGL